jgi:hypothetical protein
MTAAQLYKQLNEEKINQSQFMQQIRINPTVKHLINNVMGFSDVINVLKNKGIITEVKKPNVPTSIQKKGLLTEDCSCKDKMDEVEYTHDLDKLNPKGTDGVSMDNIHTSAPTLIDPNITPAQIKNTLNQVIADYPHLKGFIVPLLKSRRMEELLQFLGANGITLGPHFEYVRNPDLNEDDVPDISPGDEMAAGSDGSGADDFPIHTQHSQEGILSPEKWEKLLAFAKNNRTDLYYELEDAESYFFKPESGGRGTIDLHNDEFLMYIKSILKDHGIIVNLNWDIVKDPSLNENKVKEQKHSNDIEPSEYKKGLKYEYDCSKEFDSDKIIRKVLKNLKKDPFYYTNQDNGRGKMEKVNPMVPVKKGNHVDKVNGYKPLKKKLNEVQIDASEPNNTVKQAAQFISSNPTLKKYSDQIQLDNDVSGGAVLRYIYYDKLPVEVLQKLELHFTVSVDHEPSDGETSEKFAYILSLRGGIANPKDLGGAFNKFKNHLNELINEVYNEMMDEKRKLIKESKVPYDISKLGIKPGQKFTLSEGLGKFKKGDTIIVDQIKVLAEDVMVQFKGKKGARDHFYFDKNDRITL